MDKEQILGVLSKLQLSPREYIVLSGAAMTIFGIKSETEDIDLAVSQALYDKLVQSKKAQFEFSKENYSVYLLPDFNVEFSTHYFNEYYKTSVLRSGIRLQRPEDILKLKRALYRPKDLRDIALIEGFLNKQ